MAKRKGKRGEYFLQRILKYLFTDNRKIKKSLAKGNNILDYRLWNRFS
ncbi:MAG: hypothetical protein XD79_0538 [Atribacteria bacterium 34_128]|nr:MAG: hypothetical protein XD79_0538 [Atribacteria bacterium 34_128]